MDAIPPQTQVENASGNCVIITTLTSSTAAQPSVLYGFQTPEPTTRLDTSFGCQWPPLQPQQHEQREEKKSVQKTQQLNTSMLLTRTPPGAIPTDFVSCTSSKASHDNMGVNLLLDECAKRGSSVLEPTYSQTLAARHPNVVSSSWDLKHVVHLGPLVVVRPPYRASTTIKNPTGLSEPEKVSYQRQIDNLRSQLKKAEGVLEETRRHAEQRLIEKMQLLEDSHRENERSLSNRFQVALTTLRAENEELRSRVTGVEEREELAVTQMREKIESEWSNRFATSESQWRERLRTTQREWENLTEKQAQEKHEALQQLQELAHAVEELELTLRQVTREKGLAEQERDRVLAAQPCLTPLALEETSRAEVDSQRRSALEAEVVVLRRALKETECREGVLIAQLEVCGNEAAAREVELEKQLQEVRQTLENERRRGADLVKLYGTQVESLYEQLNDTMRRNKHLTKELAKFQ